MILAKGKVSIKNGPNLVHARASMLYFTLKGFRPIDISNFYFMEKHVGMSFNLRGGSMVLFLFNLQISYNINNILDFLSPNFDLLFFHFMLEQSKFHLSTSPFPWHVVKKFHTL
jgi:hypothetical protein